ncbi:Mu-like prophage FluMu I protein [Pararhodospirillum photometricum]|uniref:Mu-like prophage FluMu I protein n=1 Tax=Pararhodospirillum photometricum DSM 122 TaxID=1150469 RepID=H6SQN3_PARPM|nr:Mu-like prophage FluMu I protein [Pararhodospirillum photometricum]CCG07348.1 Mu-like prophage FluMu I protein [Pararhodospirillum photometricum DSM 122]
MPRAVCQVSLPDQSTPPEWVHLLPMGTVRGVDGRGPYVLRDQAHAAQVIAASGTGVDLPIDYDHDAILPNGRRPIAAGWIKALDARPDGIWGRVEWTTAAAAHLTAREYRYLSPVIDHTRSGDVLRLRMAGLTNTPNLSALTALASQEQLDAMDLLVPIRAALGLPDSATPDQITAAAAQSRQAAQTLTGVARALGLPDAATPDQITAATQARTSPPAASNPPDPSQYVPMSQFTALSADLAAMRQRLDTDAAGQAVTAAQAQGKVTPAMRDWALGYAAKDPQGFTAWCSAAPVLVAPGTLAPSGPAPAAPGVGDQAVTAVCSQLGLDPKALTTPATKEA